MQFHPPALAHHIVDLRQAKVYRPQFQVPCAWIDSRKRLRFTPDTNLIMQYTSDTMSQPYKLDHGSLRLTFENHSYIKLPPPTCFLSIHQQDQLWFRLLFRSLLLFISSFFFASGPVPSSYFHFSARNIKTTITLLTPICIFTPRNNIRVLSIASQS